MFRMMVALLTLNLISTQITADDQFSCCMDGMKKLRDIDLCKAPCCPGYYEVIEQPPLLSFVVYCKSLPKRKLPWSHLKLESAQKKASTRTYGEPLNRYFIG
ncbi:hypothetical protein TCAL_05425 [Tigriopus californicus]|uniref:Uncharacterized protein n=1 Tax=Tigriopus californicus TaxID=6832 RepID=A0A553NX91_TIGCA|nr:hypothetical protein TCAL_05425 [Tigriopus californicus]|eukprot:TCALIF_05425-PA protein Name:"Protein of unknown function" AED:0.00 eAED:0.00 QI:56/1/1/1/1/1/2/45/101